jgi:serine/threonine-protein kinase
MLQGEYRGLIVDGYKILYMLGSGGMGYVYAAQEPDSEWKVALKVLAENLKEDRGAVSRFQMEAQAGLRLTHPNIVRTLSINKAESIYGTIHYVVMELVQGVNLVELLELRRPISYQRAADIIAQIAEGLDYAHKQGLVHRDIKPENLLVRSNGSAKILDFGLAMLDENGEEFSMAMIHGQNCVGTADFISPEQADDSYAIDHRADIYSLGCTFYSALTCKVPFPTNSVGQKLEAHRKLQPRPLQEVRPDVPERLVKIIRKMMAKRPEDRFSSAAEVAAFLKPYAVRKSVNFDWDKVLAKRAKRAERRRLKRLLNQQSGSSITGSSITGSGINSHLNESNIETIVNKDTRLDGSSNS